MYRCVYLLFTQLVKEFSYLYNSTCSLKFFKCCTFLTYNVFKVAFILFCFVSESVRLLLASTSSELRLYIKCVRDCYL